MRKSIHTPNSTLSDRSPLVVSCCETATWGHLALPDNAEVSELIDPRPVFTVVMGCDGVGKTIWKRDNYDSLPDRYFDLDSMAGGIGDWNSPEARLRTREYVDAQITESIEKRLDFGTESSYSDLWGPSLVERVIESGYRVEGFYLGTEDPGINVERIRYRVFARTGHAVDPSRIPGRWKYSLSNLRKTAERFDLLRIFDNSDDDEFHQPCLGEQYRLERGNVVWRAETPIEWCADWIEKLTRRQEELARKARKPGGKLPHAEPRTGGSRG